MDYYSEQVEIVFSAIYSSVNQLGAKASVVQGRDVTEHLVEIVSLLQSTCDLSRRVNFLHWVLIISRISLRSGRIC